MRGVAGRRVATTESRYHSVDWHGAHLLAVSIGILILSVADAVLTLTLMSYGAVEINPVMAVLVDGSPAVFAALKIAMTGISVMMMVFLARYRFMRVVRVELILYGVLAGYMILIGHELRMLQQHPGSAPLLIFNYAASHSLLCRIELNFGRGCRSLFSFV